MSKDGNYFISPGAGSSSLYRKATQQDYDAGTAGRAPVNTPADWEYATPVADDTQSALRQHAEEDRKTNSG